jgi:hypothetical protein
VDDKTCMHVYGYSTIRETIRFEDGTIILGGIVKFYNKDGALRKIIERDNIVIRWVDGHT